MATQRRLVRCRTRRDPADRARAAAWRTAAVCGPVDALLDEADALLTAAPRIWRADPGLQVRAVDAAGGRRWRRYQRPGGPTVWRHVDHDGQTYQLRWAELLQDHAPLVDATAAEVHGG